MILVAYASALIARSVCYRLHRLDALCGEVFVSETVFHEVTRTGKPGSDRLRRYVHGKTRAVDTGRFVYLDAFADAGETEAMLLYKEIDADYLLIDDKRGRRVAKINHIRTIGSLSVLLQAKQAGLIPCLALLLRQISASPVFITESVIPTVLELAGEVDSRCDG